MKQPLFPNDLNGYAEPFVTSPLGLAAAVAAAVGGAVRPLSAWSWRAWPGLLT